MAAKRQPRPQGKAKPGPLPAYRRPASQPGHQPSKAPKRVSTVDSKGNRRNRTVKPKPQPGPYKRSKSTPGSRQQAPKRTVQGKGAKPVRMPRGKGKA